MPTTVTNSIGTTGRTYSTIQAWEDACPANLVTADQIWKGECYNDSEFTGGVTISGQTTDATRYVWLTAAAGQSFIDHADVRTNPLIYDLTKGVGCSYTGDRNMQPNNNCLIERIQFRRTNNAYNTAVVDLGKFVAGPILKDCIVQYDVSSGGWTLVVRDNVAINVAVIRKATGASGKGVYATNSTALLLNCTVVNGSGSAEGTAFGGNYNSAAIRNCAFFGWGTLDGGPGVPSSGNSSYNATDISSGLPGSNNQHSVSFSSSFESTTVDFRLKAGSPLIGVGNTDATNAPNDITGTARGSGTAGDIGAWEYTAGGGGGTDIPEHLLRMRRPGVVWSNNTGA